MTTTRRQFLKTSVAAAVALAIPALPNTTFNTYGKTWALTREPISNADLHDGILTVFKTLEDELLDLFFHNVSMTPEFSAGKLNISLHN